MQHNKNIPLNTTVCNLGEAEKVLEIIQNSSNISSAQIRQLIIKARYLIKIGSLSLFLAEAHNIISQDAKSEAL